MDSVMLLFTVGLSSLVQERIVKAMETEANKVSILFISVIC